MFRKATNEQCFLKCGILGFAGSGKSFTATSIAIGLHTYTKSKAPILFLDTETGSDFLLHRFEQAKKEVLVAKTRAFVDLLKAVDEAEKMGAILIIDSITHFWNELLLAYQKKKNKNRLTLQDWMPIKQEWRVYTDKFVNSKCHIIMCGRAGWEFDYEKDEEGVNELIKIGTKMKAETEMGYEPSLLLEMERVRVEKGKIGSSYVHRCWVLKDRFDKINGKFFDNPTFEAFLPHISLLNIGGEHVGFDATRTSVDLFDTENSAYEQHKLKQIVLEEIRDTVYLLFPTRTAEAKENMIRKMKEIFGTNSATAIENKPLQELQEGLKKLKKELEEKEAMRNGNTEGLS